ncbi:tumor necrosis factor a (TNF superfamily, member 2) [Colossoma macropomum]|uniref:tumor necrosis factor a (TNF superfamily, member 2) n=1 Tax=Colossoma macropomum TaxID=42526 RepID=UPI0018646E26|nr:tumor necrosis factor a (TNF superfamily, member 2) [Colossoma macropomum]
MSTDKQIVLDVDLAQVMVSREKSSSAWSGRWRLVMALLAVALCTAAAVFFTFNKQTQHKPDETDDIRHTLRQVSSSAKAAIHLLGHYNENNKESVDWWDNDGQSFTEGGLKLKDNQIHIPHDGLYFVYSQASYRVSCSSNADGSDEEAVVQLSHMVYRWSDSYGDEKPLLSAVRTACTKSPKQSEEDDEVTWFGAIYLGAVFKLQAGDRLYTKMMEKMLPQVETNQGMTFFGVFAL